MNMRIVTELRDYFASLNVRSQERVVILEGAG